MKNFLYRLKCKCNIGNEEYQFDTEPEESFHELMRLNFCSIECKILLTIYFTQSHDHLLFGLLVNVIILASMVVKYLIH